MSIFHRTIQVHRGRNRERGGLPHRFRLLPVQGVHADAPPGQQQGQVGPGPRRAAQARRHEPGVQHADRRPVTTREPGHNRQVQSQSQALPRLPAGRRPGGRAAVHPHAPQAGGGAGVAGATERRRRRQQRARRQ